jgi:hypothetical protein
MALNGRAYGAIALILASLAGCGDRPINEVSQGVQPLPRVARPLTAREALAVVHPMAEGISRQPVLLVISSGFGINAEGRCIRWDFVFHFPDRSAQAVYSFEPEDPESSGSPLLVKWRVSPRPAAKGRQAGLPFAFTDSPEAARRLADQGVDFVTGDSDLTLATDRLSSGEIVWVVESDGRVHTTPFVTADR